jgi:predicted component of type VI protein secretion system
VQPKLRLPALGALLGLNGIYQRLPDEAASILQIIRHHVSVAANVEKLRLPTLGALLGLNGIYQRLPDEAASILQIIRHHVSVAANVE